MNVTYEMMTEFWGDGTALSVLQMTVRGIIVFLLALVLIRISGRRSFGMGSPIDNIIVILLGAILSRAVVGASPFLPVLTTCTAIVLLHRFLSWYKMKSNYFRLVEGRRIIIFENDQFIKANLDRALLHTEDVMQELRKTAQTDNLSNIERIYIERTGEISFVKKNATEPN